MNVDLWTLFSLHPLENLVGVDDVGVDAQTVSIGQRRLRIAFDQDETLEGSFAEGCNVVDNELQRWEGSSQEKLAICGMLARLVVLSDDVAELQR